MSGETNAAWVEHERTIDQLDQVRLVAMSTEDDPSIHIAQSGSNGSRMRWHEPTIHDILDEILIVVGRRAVTGDDAILDSCC